MAHRKLAEFDPAVFLAETGLGRTAIHYDARQELFSQGEPADATFYILEGTAKLMVTSSSGKEATLQQLTAGDFVGEESLAAVFGLRMASAVAITPCVALRIARNEMIRVIHEEVLFSEKFLAFLLARSLRAQAALVDRLFNSSEKRLARILLLLAEVGIPDQSSTLLAPITQEALAEMVGTTRARVSFFMNRFRTLGLIEYDRRIKVHKSLLNVVLHE